jgi:hypothetical protein
MSARRNHLTTIGCRSIMPGYALVLAHDGQPIWDGQLPAPNEKLEGGARYVYLHHTDFKALQAHIRNMQ